MYEVSDVHTGTRLWQCLRSLCIYVSVCVSTRACVYARSLLGCAYPSTQGGGAIHDCFGVLMSTTFPLFRNLIFAHGLPHPSWVLRKVHLNCIRVSFALRQTCWTRSGWIVSNSNVSCVVPVISIIVIIIIIITIIY